MEYSQSDVDSLASKLAGADLSDGEWSVMAALVQAATEESAAEDEVTGFGCGLKIGFAELLPRGRDTVATSSNGEIFMAPDVNRDQNLRGGFGGSKHGIVAQSGNGEI